jgi:putative tricarboxylic transport membrane protein
MQVERVGTLFWLAVGLVSIYGSTRLGLGALREPGSGFLPLIAGCFISLMAVFLFLNSFLRKQKTQAKLSPFWVEVHWHRPLIISLLTFGFVLVLERLGFILAGFFLLVILFKGVEKFSWKKAMIIPTITLGLTYLLFNVFLKASLPKGIFGF